MVARVVTTPMVILVGMRMGLAVSRKVINKIPRTGDFLIQIYLSIVLGVYNKNADWRFVGILLCGLFHF